MNTHEPSERDHQVNAAIAEYLEAAEAGCRPALAEFLARHADIAAELKAFLEDHEQFRRFAEPVASLHVAEDPRTAATLAPGAPPVVSEVLGKVRYFGDYELLQEIARGGMGVVYKARQTSLKRIVALKMILAGELASPTDVQRFHTEAEAAARLDHPGIVPIYEIGQHEGQHYFSMGYVEGQSLAHRVVEGVLPPREAAELMKLIAQAISYAHVEGVVHRDLKPANVLLDKNGQPRVTDFGLAKRLARPGGDARASDLTGTGQILGTPSYMPPEQASGKTKLIGPLSDVYSLGAVFYCLLTGRPPFQAATPLDTLLQVIDQEPVSPRQLNAAVPRDLETICQKCLQKEPERRYASAQELVDDLQRFLSGEPIKARPVGKTERLWRWCRRNQAVAVLSLLVLVLMAVAVTLPSIEAYKLALQKQKALVLLDLAQRESYFNQVRLAQMHWQSNNVPAAEKLLDQCEPDRRGWEWKYLKRLCHTALHILRGHTERISSVAFTADGRIAAMQAKVRNAEHGRVRFWDAATGEPSVFLIGDMIPTEVLNADLITSDGSLLIAQMKDMSLEVYDPALMPRGTFRGHKFPVQATAVSRDGNYLVTVAAREETVTPGQPTILSALGNLNAVKGEIRLWDLKTGKPLASSDNANPLYDVAFSPDGTRFAVPGKIYETKTLKPLATLDAGSFVVGWSPDDHFIATALGGAVATDVELWDAKTGRHVRTLRGHTDWIRALAFSADGKRLASASDDRSAKIWDVASGAELATVRGHADGVSGVAFNRDGTRLVTSGSLDRTVRVWDITHAQEAVSLTAPSGDIYALAYSADGRLLASADAAGGIRVRDAASGMVLAQFYHYEVSSIAFSPDGKQLASAGFDKMVKIWDINRLGLDGNKGALARTLIGHTNHVSGVAFSPDGLHIASTSWDDSVKLWNVANGTLVWTVPLGVQQGFAVAFSPGGDQLAVGALGAMFVLDPSTGKVLRETKNLQSGVHALAFSPDGKHLAFNDRSAIHIWEAGSGQHLRTLDCGGWVQCLAFSVDGARLVSSGEDGSIRFWDWNFGAGREVLSLRAHSGRGGARALAFSPDGDRLASGGSDRTIKIWNAKLPEK